MDTAIHRRVVENDGVVSDSLRAVLDLESEEGRFLWNAWSRLDDTLAMGLGNGNATATAHLSAMRDAMEDLDLGKIQRAWGRLERYLIACQRHGRLITGEVAERMARAMEPFKK